jgi:hypothetical protein
MVSHATRKSRPHTIACICMLLTGCASHSISVKTVTPLAKCVSSREEHFVTAATRYPDASIPLGMFSFPLGLRDGDLILAQDALRFATCTEQGEVEALAATPYGDIELAYRLGNWVFVRNKPSAQHHRQRCGYLIHDNANNSRGDLAIAALNGLRARMPPLEQGARPAEWRDARLLVVAQNKPSFLITVIEPKVIEQEADPELGKKVGKGAAAGAAGGAAAVLLAVPETGGLSLYPPFAGAMIVAGAIIGATKEGMDATKTPPAIVHMLPLEDAVLVKAATDMDLPGLLSREVQDKMAIEKHWPLAATRTNADDLQSIFEDYAMRGIVGVIYLSTPDLVLLADPADPRHAPDISDYALSLRHRASLISSVTGREVVSIDFSTSLGVHTLADWRKDDAARLREAVEVAVKDIADKIAMKVQRNLDDLVVLE